MLTRPRAPMILLGLAAVVLALHTAASRVSAIDETSPLAAFVPDATVTAAPTAPIPALGAPHVVTPPAGRQIVAIAVTSDGESSGHVGLDLGEERRGQVSGVSRVYLGLDDGTVVVHARGEASPVTLPTRHETAVVAIAANATHLASVDKGGLVRVRSLASPEKVTDITFPAVDLAFSADGATLRGIARDGRIVAWRVIGGAVVKSVGVTEKRPIRVARLAPGGAYGIIAVADG